MERVEQQLNLDASLSEAKSPPSHDAACSGRREFFVRAGMTAGGLVLGLSSLRAADEAPGAEKTAADANANSDEIVLKLADPSPLSKVGGFTTLETGAGKIVVARTGESSFAACSAVCTHRGGPIEFNAESQQFFCPLHRSVFALDGSVVKGPAREALDSYGAQSAAVVSLKTT